MSTMTAVYNGHSIHSGREPGRDMRRDVDTADHRESGFPRSASYTFMPSVPTNQAYARKSAVPITIKGSLYEEDLLETPDLGSNPSPLESQNPSGWTTPNEDLKMHADSAHDLVAELHKSAKITASHLAKAAHETSTATNAAASAPSLPLDTLVGPNKSNPTLSVSPSTSPSDSAEPPAPPAQSDRLHSSFAKRLSRRLSSTPTTSSSREPSPAKSSKRSSFIKIDSHGEESKTESIPPVPDTPVSRKRTLLRKRDSTYDPDKAKPSEFPSESKPSEAKSSETRPDKRKLDKPKSDKTKSSESKSSEVKPPEKKKSGETRSSETKSSGGILSRTGTILGRKPTKARKPSKQPNTSNFAESPVRASLENTKTTPAVPMLPKSFSTDRLPSATQTHHDRHVPVPRIVPTEKMLNHGGLSLPKKRDELWSVFRSLDGDYTKFQNKSSALKANVVRSSLLPFLRNYADHPSSFTLRAEDLDRRTNILNKWWTALLEMLHGKNNQSISGTDRPAILDALAGIMERPEWRLSPSPLCPLTRRNTGIATPATKSTTSLALSGSDFLSESVHHNVRNMFLQNLNSQMAFVVDRMSLRNASASLVTFCGKATAYAFFFCPGIAEVLVRLWDTPTNTMRRVLDENQVGKFDNLGETSARIVSAFPPVIQQLGFCSLGKLLKHLRTQIALPIGTANIQWYGYWLERWLGRESDLFYAFVKNFHILVTDYLPPDATKKERMCVPGLLLVHAQILANLDSTIHRDAGQSQADGSAGLASIYDDVLADPNAVASTIPLPPTNAIRVMAENRLIMLIRDFLSDRATEHPRARHLFALSFNDLLQACARGISAYDHSACYTLCDFLEEALLILVRYEQTIPVDGPLISTKFWLDVCKRMISSQNTMTEVRLYAFLYTVWSFVTGNPDRRADICLELLLDEAIFERTFNHWCPMVRAYYMRLICWRVGRYDGESEASPRTRMILETLMSRLRSVWSHYLWLKQEAENGQSLGSSTVPCNPAPGRRLLIIRTDTQMPTSGSFLAFDGLVPHTSAPLASPSVAGKRHTTLSPVVELDSRPNSSCSSDAGSTVERERGIRGFFRSVMGVSRSTPKTSGQSRASANPNRLSVASAPTASSAASINGPASRPATHDPRSLRSQLPASTTGGNVRDTPAIRHHNFSFKFSLEFQTKHYVPGPMRLIPPRLPAAAQAYVQSQSNEVNSPVYMSQAVEPVGEAKTSSKYAGRALAEWAMVIVECQSFFDRRKNEGVPNNRYVETPTLGVEVLSKKSA